MSPPLEPALSSEPEETAQTQTADQNQPPEPTPSEDPQHHEDPDFDPGEGFWRRAYESALQRLQVLEERAEHQLLAHDRTLALLRTLEHHSAQQAASLASLQIKLAAHDDLLQHIHAQSTAGRRLTAAQTESLIKVQYAGTVSGYTACLGMQMRRAREGLGAEGNAEKRELWREAVGQIERAMGEAEADLEGAQRASSVALTNLLATQREVERVHEPVLDPPPPGWR